MLPVAFDCFYTEGPRCTEKSGVLGCMVLWDDVHVRQLLDFVRDLALLQSTQVHHINDVLPEIVLAGVGFMPQTHTCTKKHPHRSQKPETSDTCQV